MLATNLGNLPCISVFCFSCFLPWPQSSSTAVPGYPGLLFCASSFQPHWMLSRSRSVHTRSAFCLPRAFHQARGSLLFACFKCTVPRVLQEVFTHLSSLHPKDTAKCFTSSTEKEKLFLAPIAVVSTEHPAYPAHKAQSLILLGCTNASAIKQAKGQPAHLTCYQLATKFRRMSNASTGDFPGRSTSEQPGLASKNIKFQLLFHPRQDRLCIFGAWLNAARDIIFSGIMDRLSLSCQLGV